MIIYFNFNIFIIWFKFIFQFEFNTEINYYTNIYGDRDVNAEGCVSAKYLIHGVIQIRNESTGLRVYYGLREMLKNDINSINEFFIDDIWKTLIEFSNTDNGLSIIMIKYFDLMDILRLIMKFQRIQNS